MIEEFPVGTPLQLDSTWTVNNALADPTTLALTIEQPDGTSATITAWPPDNAVIAQVSLGVFKAVWTPTQLGRHSYRWVGTGSASGVLEGQFDVVSVVVGALSILKVAGDYEAVRQVLGVTAIDVNDALIEGLPFGQDAESRVKDRWPTWATDLIDPVLGPRLRLATVYLTASRIAATFAQGGMIGFIRPNQAANRDWAKVAVEMQEEYEEVLGLTGAPAGTEAMYDLTGQVVSGPTSRYGAWSWVDSATTGAMGPVDWPDWLHGAPQGIVD